jgi:hypothetical protein
MGRQSEPHFAAGPAQMGSSSTVGQGLGGAGIVRPEATGVTFAFTPNRASMPAQAAGNLGI